MASILNADVGNAAAPGIHMGDSLCRRSSVGRPPKRVRNQVRPGGEVYDIAAMFEGVSHRASDCSGVISQSIAGRTIRSDVEDAGIGRIDDVRIGAWGGGIAHDREGKGKRK